jgi:hypothetical protein
LGEDVAADEHVVASHITAEIEGDVAELDRAAIPGNDLGGGQVECLDVMPSPELAVLAWMGSARGTMAAVMPPARRWA